MAICSKCNRVLAASGGCLYCGTVGGAEAVAGRFAGKPSRLRKILVRVLIVALIAWAGHFLFFTEAGHSITGPLRKAIGLDKAPAP